VIVGNFGEVKPSWLVFVKLVVGKYSVVEKAWFARKTVNREFAALALPFVPEVNLRRVNTSLVTVNKTATVF